MVADDLPFSLTTADRLIKIAADQRLSSVPAESLPPRWSTLYELTKLSDDDWDELRPKIDPTMERSTVTKANRGRPTGRNLSLPVTSLEFHFPESPTVNQMIDLAKKRNRGGRAVVYDAEKKRYYEHCDILVLAGKLPKPPKTEWARWRLVSVHFRTYNVHDFFEMIARLKWPVDWLVSRDYVRDDSPRELVPPLPWPTWEVERGDDRGATVVIARVD
jgi:hypothetical protein